MDTDHARTRMQQRGIRVEAIEALLDYGRASPAGEGCELVFFDKDARARLWCNPALAREAERLCRTFAVLGRDGAVVTVGHRYRRVPRA